MKVKTLFGIAKIFLLIFMIVFIGTFAMITLRDKPTEEIYVSVIKIDRFFVIRDDMSSNIFLITDDELEFSFEATIFLSMNNNQVLLLLNGGEPVDVYVQELRHFVKLSDIDYDLEIPEG